MIYDFSFKNIEVQDWTSLHEEECNLSDDLLSEKSVKNEEVRGSISSKNMAKSILSKGNKRAVGASCQRLMNTKFWKSQHSNINFDLLYVSKGSLSCHDPSSPCATDINKSCDQGSESGKSSTKEQISSLLRSMAKCKEEEKRIKQKPVSTFKRLCKPASQKIDKNRSAELTMEQVNPAQN